VNPAIDQAQEAQRVAAADKLFSTRRAQLAMRGFQMHILAGADGKAEYLVHQGALATVLPDMAAVEAFARTVGAV
jgi:hypothetical protein